MRYGKPALAASALVFAAAAASAGEGRPAGDAAGIIAAREAGMMLSGALMGQIKGGIDRGDDVKTMGFAARAMNEWAKAVPGMFPAGSEGGDALPAIWSDRAGFEARAAAYAAATAKLGDAVKTGDKAAFAAAFGEVRASCGGCHDSFKKPMEH